MHTPIRVGKIALKVFHARRGISARFCPPNEAYSAAMRMSLPCTEAR